MQAKLSKIQSDFAQDLLRYDDASILPHLKGASVTAAERFAIYRGNLLAIWNKSLANAFPVIQQLVGSDYFEDLARSYGRAHASQIGDLNAFGGHFAQFLETVDALREYAYMGAVAELEWLVHRAYYMSNAEAHLSLPQFIQAAGEAVQQAQLQMNPNVHLFSGECAAVPIWKAHQESEFPGMPEDLHAPSYAVVVRPAWRVEVLQLDQAAFYAVRELQVGATLESALDRALQIDPQFDVATQLQAWFAAGLFSGFECKESGSSND